MAGESITLVTEYPDEFTTVTHVVHDGSLANFPWIYADRAFVVDSVNVCAMGTAVGGTATLQLIEVVSGTIPTSGNIDSGTTVSSTISIAANTAVTAGTITTTANTIAVGNWLCVRAVAGGGTLSNFRGAIQVRLRTRLK